MPSSFSFAILASFSASGRRENTHGGNDQSRAPPVLYPRGSTFGTFLLLQVVGVFSHPQRRLDLDFVVAQQILQTAPRSDIITLTIARTLSQTPAREQQEVVFSAFTMPSRQEVANQEVDGLMLIAILTEKLVALALAGEEEPQRISQPIPEFGTGWGRRPVSRRPH